MIAECLTLLLLDLGARVRILTLLKCTTVYNIIGLYWFKHTRIECLTLVTCNVQPIGRFQGQATDVDIARKEIRNVKMEMVFLHPLQEEKADNLSLNSN